jgi:hypothetical protein
MKILHLFMKVACFMIAFFILLFDSYGQINVEIQEGTVIRVRLLETIDSKIAKNGDVINLETIERVEINGVLGIEANSRVVGRIINSVQNKSMGRKGKLDISIDYVRAKDGTNVPLSYSLNQAGKDNSVAVLAGAVLISPVALFIKGKSAVLTKGTEFNTYVSRTTKLNL